MNHRERFFEALERREPDCVPITDLTLEPPTVEAILGRKMGFGQTAYGCDMSVSMREGDVWESQIKYRLAMIEACRKLDFDAVPALEDRGLVTKRFKPNFIDETKWIDQWGRVRKTSLVGKTTYFVGGTVSTPEELEEYEPPDAFDSDIFEMMERILKPIMQEDIVRFADCHSSWNYAFQVRGGIDKITVDFFNNPDFARKLLDKVGRACQNFAEAMIEAGIEVLFVSDDYADTHGPLMNPKLFREFELPNLKKIVEIGRKHGVPVLKHSCGKVYQILDDIVNTGIAGLHPIEPRVMDLGYVKEKYGDRICLLGNVDCAEVLPFGSEDDVRKDVRRCIDAAARGGGYVLMSSNSLHANVKIKNVYAMYDEARKYGKYPMA